ncbi:MAG: glycosyltransferase family 9 protein [Verrucomicrobiae bacterium]
MSGCYAVFHKQLGDLVLLEPSLSRLRDFHGTPVRLMTRNGHADLVGLMPGVEVVRGPALVPAPALYCFDPLNKSALRSALAPVLKRHLVAPEKSELSWYHPFVFRRPSHPELGGSYISEFFWKNTPVPSGQPFRPPVLKPPPDGWAPDGWEPGGYVLVNATSGWKKKMWTVEGWAAVLKLLDCPCVLTSDGAGWQTAHCGGIAEASGSALLATTLRQFLWLCANARMILTVDGAASHLAAAFGVPCFTLFGPSNIAHWHRPAPRHAAFQAPPDSDGVRRLKKLPPEPVIEAVRQFLSRSDHGRGGHAM